MLQNLLRCLFSIIVLAVTNACSSVSRETELIREETLSCTNLIQASCGDDTGKVDYSVGPRQFGVDEVGAVYILDPPSRRVLVFSPSGEHTQSIFIPGAGSDSLGSDLAVRGGRLAIYGSMDGVPGAHVFTLDSDTEAYEFLPGYSLCGIGVNARNVLLDGTGDLITCQLGVGWHTSDVGGTVFQTDRNGETSKLYVGEFHSVAVGWGGMVYIGKPSCDGNSNPQETCVLKLDEQGKVVDEIRVKHEVLEASRIVAFGLLEVVDNHGYLYGNAGFYGPDRRPAIPIVTSDGEHVSAVVLRQYLPMGLSLVIDGDGRWYIPKECGEDTSPSDTFRILVCPLGDHLED